MKKRIYIITVSRKDGNDGVYESTMSWQCAMDILHNLAMGSGGWETVKIYAYDLDWETTEWENPGLDGEGEIVAYYTAPEHPQDRIVAHVTMPKL